MCPTFCFSVSLCLMEAVYRPVVKLYIDDREFNDDVCRCIPIDWLLLKLRVFIALFDLLTWGVDRDLTRSADVCVEEFDIEWLRLFFFWTLLFTLLTPTQWWILCWILGELFVRLFFNDTVESLLFDFLLCDLGCFILLFIRRWTDFFLRATFATKFQWTLKASLYIQPITSFGHSPFIKPINRKHCLLFDFKQTKPSQARD